ncbi:MAG: radical SAM protein [Spirochaetes bacterium]|nr:radical SAM protein [Spirochaetota bacterium]MBN2769918.1 radical SAM protein [Spirochaetota bacterium]
MINYLKHLRLGKNSTCVNPMMLTAIITFRCNARCVMCDSWKKTSHKEISVKDFEQIFQSLGKMHLVRLSGGEPFVRDDFTVIADSAVRILRPRLLHVTSNGFLTQRIVNFVINRDRSVPLFLLFSIDGMHELHDEIRGIKGAWNMVNRTIEELSSLRKKYNFGIAINQTIVNENSVSEYSRLRKHFEKHRVSVNVVFAYDESSTYTLDAKGITNSAEQFKTVAKIGSDKLINLFNEVQDGLKGASLGHRILKKYYYNGMYNRLIKDFDSPNPKCAALGAHMRIFPDGSVPVCQFNSTIIGNLAKDGFDKVWNSEKVYASRNWVKNCKGCWAECEVLPSAFYSGDILKSICMYKKFLNINHD